MQETTTCFNYSIFVAGFVDTVTDTDKLVRF